MTRTEQRISDFSSGLKKLGEDSRNYINRLANVLLLVDRKSIQNNPQKIAESAAESGENERKL